MKPQNIRNKMEEKDMKKLVTGIAALALAFSISTIDASAADSGRGRNFVDANNDGICDYCSVSASCEFVDADNDGICDNYSYNSSKRKGRGRFYVDSDGDGICDNAATGTPYRQNGKGAGRGRSGRCRRQSK